MDRWVTAQVFVNLVLLANILVIQRRLRAREAAGSAALVATLPAPEARDVAPAPPRAKRRGLVLTLGLGGSSPRKAAPEVLGLGLAALVEAAERGDRAPRRGDSPSDRRSEAPARPRTQLARESEAPNRGRPEATESSGAGRREPIASPDSRQRAAEDLRNNLRRLRASIAPGAGAPEPSA